MNITLQISDNAYRALVAGNCRIQGSIGLVSPTEGNFHEYRRWMPAAGSKFIKLPHGRASVSEKQVRLTLSIDPEEADIDPAEAIDAESRQAGDFVFKMLNDIANY
ncbi:hypothetical protein [Phocaeicola sp.]|nr:hypothetical protein [Bacteroides sp.]